jgi:hypothetical protein
MSEEIKNEESAPPPLNGGVFIGARPPVWPLEHEQPWHRMAAEFFSMGDTAKGVALKMGKSQPAVLNLLRQPWFQRMVTQRMAETGAKQDVFKLFQREQFTITVRWSSCGITRIRPQPLRSGSLRACLTV